MKNKLLVLISILTLLPFIVRGQNEVIDVDLSEGDTKNTGIQCKEEITEYIDKLVNYMSNDQETWTDSFGKSYKIYEMTNKHLANVIHYLENNNPSHILLDTLKKN